MITQLDKWKPGTHRKVFLAGKPKSAGKTTFAMTAPGSKLVLQYDLGNAVIPPGVDPASVWFKGYEASEPGLNPDSDRWKKAKNVGESIIRDIQAVKESYRTGNPLMIDGQEIPQPETIILDGVTEMVAVVVDWILAVNNKQDPDDFVGESGKPNFYKLWTKRLEIVRNLFNAVIPLPANVIIIGWETPEMKTDGRGNSNPTGQIVPDIGGKLDNLIAGKVDAALRCYSQNGKFYVQTQPDGFREWIGIRGAYGLPKEIDVTIDPRMPKALSPWERVFGKVI